MHYDAHNTVDGGAVQPRDGLGAVIRANHVEHKVRAHLARTASEFKQALKHSQLLSQL